MKKFYVLTTAVVLCTTMTFGQNDTRQDTDDLTKVEVQYPCSIGSSLWVLSNLFDDPDHFYQLNFGYLLTERDNLIVEAITWTYDEPLGTYGSDERAYPGEVKAYGLGIGYQRFHWKKLYTTVQANNFLQQFYDAKGSKIQKGYQLYLQFILGYRIELFKKRWYVEPAYSFRYWPVNTNFPEDFAAIERGRRNYKVEASLNFGFRF